MAKGRDKQGREVKKKKKQKQPAADARAMEFRHHAVVTGQPPSNPPRTGE